MPEDRTDSPRAPEDPHRDLRGALHDVSNALTVMLGWMARASSVDVDGDSRDHAIQIAERHARIARDLARRAIGAPVRGPATDEYVESIVDGVVDALALESEQRSVQIERVRAAGGVRVHHPTDMIQILTNLLLNALAYAPTGTRVVVDERCDTRLVQIEISDEGIGIDQSRASKVFDGETTRHGGAGVGLRHARAVARAVGGEIELVTRDVGACFRLTWPRVFRRISYVSFPASEQHASLDGLRVLVLEDDAAVSGLLDAALSSRGVTVVTARSVESIPSGDQDVLLLDLSPIKETLVASVALLRERFPSARLVFISGDFGADDAIGSELWLQKPFEIRDVLGLLERLRAPEAAPATPPA